MYDSIQHQDYLCMVASLSLIEAELFSVETETEPLFRDVPKAPPISRFQISLPEIAIHGRVFELYKPIDLLLYEDEGVWVCEWCGILSAGCTLEEAAVSFCEDFSTFWDEIAQAPDSSLTKRAQATKDCLLSVVKSVR